MGLSQIFDQVGANIELDPGPTLLPGTNPMSALGHKPTCAVQNVMSALYPIATAKADIRKRSCLLYPRKADMCSARGHVCFGPIADIAILIRSPRQRDQALRAVWRSQASLTL